MQKQAKIRSSNTLALVETALLVAVGFVLSCFTLVIKLPQGGNVTPLSMLPILLIGIRRGPAWGIGGALVYSGLQLLQGLENFGYVPKTFGSFLMVALLDFVVAFGVLGLSGLFGRMKNGLLVAAPMCLALRFACHFVSGILIWASWTPEGTPVWLYSLTYNGTYMGIELIMTTAATFALCKTVPKLMQRQD